MRIMYWVIPALIIIIGISVFLYTRTIDQEHEIIYNPLTPIEKAQVDRNIQDAIDKAKKNQPPIDDVDHQEKPHNNSQHNGNVETADVENYLEGLEDIDLFASITIPTEGEMSSYTFREIMDYSSVISEAMAKSREINEEITDQSVAISKTRDGIRDVGKRLQLQDQSHKLRIKFNNLLEQDKRLAQESERIHQHLRKFK